ncbi:MAG: TauD/TfdA family dioxygenase [Chloroflexota bacterium]
MTTTRQLTVTPLSDITFGAIVTNVDLTNLNDTTWTAIETAFNEYGLLIFLEQHLNADTLPVFAKRFGSLSGGGAVGSERASSISNRQADSTRITEQDPLWLTRNYPTQYWHTDGTFSPVAPKICMLSAASVTSDGGQTAFADMSAAYDALDPSTQDKIANLSAYHSNLIGTTRVLPQGNQAYFRSLVGDEPVDGYYGLCYRAECPLRPLVRVHPETGRSSLLVGRHTFGIPGMALAEAEQFLHELETFACQPPRIYEHEWQIGDLIVFDNRRLLHRACPYDELDEMRELLNCRIAGDVETDSGLDTVEAQRSVEVQREELTRLRGRYMSSAQQTQ